MDPVSLTSLGIGVASVSFQLFAGCIKGFVQLSIAQSFGTDSSTLTCMLNLQELQLTEWARRAGLLAEEPTLDRRLNAKIIEAVLNELRDLLLDTDKLKSQYKLSLVMDPPTIQSDAPSVSSPVLQSILSHAIPKSLRGEIMQRAKLIQSTNSFPRRWRWAVVDKNKFEELLRKISFLVRELWNLFDPIIQEEMSERLHTVLSQLISMSEKIKELSSLCNTLKSSSPMDNPLKSQDEALSLASAAEIKAIGLDKGSTTSISESSSVRSTMCVMVDFDIADLEDFAPMKHNPWMGIAKHNDTIVFVERKSMSVQSRNKLVERARNLAILLSTPKHSDFRCLRCKGIAHEIDSATINFVYDLPVPEESLSGSVSRSFQPPQSLRSLFRLTPSVTIRLRLAIQLAQSIKYFHTAGWLHKNLKSENILFFSSEMITDRLAPLPDPILAGFAFSRLNSPSEISEQPGSDPQSDIYRHPEAMGEPSSSFNAVKDIYALGTILLEIGEWRPLKTLVARVVDISKPNVAISDLIKVRPFLLDDSPTGGLGMLRYRMGDVYAKVTKMMLSGRIPESWKPPEHLDAVCQPQLLDVAVRELKKCAI